MHDSTRISVEASGPIKRIRRNIVNSAVWPLEAVVGWRYAQLAGLGDRDRDALMRRVAECGCLAIDATRPDWYELLRQALNDILEKAFEQKLTLFDRAGTAVTFGASAELDVDGLSFSLYRDKPRCLGDRIDGLWCGANEAKSCLKPDNRISARKVDNLTRWLEQKMYASPFANPFTKEEWREKANEAGYRVSERQFDRCWLDAVRNTRSNWSKAGRPRRRSPENPVD
jgi:hypothetical protein